MWGVILVVWVCSVVGCCGCYVLDLFVSMGGGLDDGKLNIWLDVIWKMNGMWVVVVVGNGM